MNRIDTAENHYLGKNDHQRMNCAQAIIASYYASGDKDSLLVDFASFGGGRAPENHCGALYAAKQILGSEKSENASELTSKFIEKAGSFKCKEIRMGKKLSCQGCVHLAAEYLSEIVPA